MSYTLNTMDRHAVAYGVPLGFRAENTREYEEKATTVCNGTRPGYCNAVVYAVDCRNAKVDSKTNGTLQANESGTSLNLNNVVIMATGQANAEVTGNVIPCLNCNHEQPIVFDARGNGDGKAVPTITGDHENRVTDYTAVCVQNTGQGWWNQTDVAATVRTPCGGDSTKANLVIQRIVRRIVRRLTPTECGRLQGYPDGWCDIGEWVDSKWKKHKDADTPKYKAFGNSIALPQWWWLTRKMAIYLPEDAKLGSLFDGIGGFPLVWEECHGKGTARWASEIEEFPIAVTKYHFPE